MASQNHGRTGDGLRRGGSGRSRGWAGQTLRIAATAGLAGVGVLGLGGCEWDSFIDPSVVGRWEHTPTVVPVLERLSSIEDESMDYVEMTDVTPEDLIPDVSAYRVGPGDGLLIDLYDDIDNRGVPSRYERQVDIRGYIDLPQLGQLSVRNMNVEQVQAIIAQALSKYVNDPLVAVIVTQQRQQTFNLIGLIDQPGPYFISKPDFRLLEALTSGGVFPQTMEEIYVIRQIPLSDVVKGLSTPAPVPPAGEVGTQPPSPADAAKPEQPAQPGKPKSDDNLIDLIDELSKPKEPAPGETPAATPPTEPPKQDQPAQDAPKRPALSLIASEHSAVAPARRQSAQPPPIDLLDSKSPPTEAGKTPPPAAQNGDSSWVFLDGQWVQVKRGAGATPGAPERLTADQLMTQRVIRIPLKPLLAGLSQYNIVVRPGDVIHIPTPRQGLVYVAGQVQRPGPYNLPDIGRLTLIRAIDSAGGLSAIGIPEKVDLTRVVGRDRQATIRLNYRAIVEGTQPDVYMRADDRINVGTNFWAYPLAVLRNGLRISYGFGFVVDRNFDIEIFGPQPVRFR